MERLVYSADSANRIYRITKRDTRGAHILVEAPFEVEGRVLVGVHDDIEATVGMLLCWQPQQLRPHTHLTRHAATVWAVTCDKAGRVMVGVAGLTLSTLRQLETADEGGLLPCHASAYALLHTPPGTVAAG